MVTEFLHTKVKKFFCCINIPLTLYSRKGSRDISDPPRHFMADLAMRNTADATGGKLITVRLQSSSDVSTFNSLVAF
jgi:hypothetical protein